MILTCWLSKSVADVPSPVLRKRSLRPSLAPRISHQCQERRPSNDSLRAQGLSSECPAKCVLFLKLTRAEHCGRGGQIGAVRFTRDQASCHVSWFVLNAGRIQNFHFVKGAKWIPVSSARQVIQVVGDKLVRLAFLRRREATRQFHFDRRDLGVLFALARGACQLARCD